MFTICIHNTSKCFVYTFSIDTFFHTRKPITKHFLVGNMKNQCCLCAVCRVLTYDRIEINFLYFTLSLHCNVNDIVCLSRVSTCIQLSALSAFVYVVVFVHIIFSFRRTLFSKYTMFFFLPYLSAVLLHSIYQY